MANGVTGGPGPSVHEHVTEASSQGTVSVITHSLPMEVSHVMASTLNVSRVTHKDAQVRSTTCTLAFPLLCDMLPWQLVTGQICLE